MITLDGSQGEGGGQIVRSAVTLSAITGQPVEITQVRAGRENSGLRPQHVTAIEAVATICQAKTSGVEVGSDRLTFEPGAAVRAGEYEWGVGTAGSACLVAQAVILPLALAAGETQLKLYGGTHVPNSPSGHYLRDVYAPMLLRMGIDVEIFMDSYGFMPEGGGMLTVFLKGGARPQSQRLVDRGPLERILGTAVGCNLPSHIPQRMANRAINLLDAIEAIDVPLDIRPVRTRSVSTGAGIFLAAEYENGQAGFGVLGRRGMPSEEVAERAVTPLLIFHDSGAAVDERLMDQLILPLALAEGPSVVSTSAITRHLRTNIEVVRAFLDRRIVIDEARRLVTVDSQ